jgi:hypothetical protein
VRFLWLLIFLATSALAQTGTCFIGSVNALKHSPAILLPIRVIAHDP